MFILVQKALGLQTLIVCLYFQIRGKIQQIKCKNNISMI